MTLITQYLNLTRHRTSIRLEREVWDGFKQIAEEQGCSVHQLGTYIALKKARDESLTSAIRLFAFNYFRERAEAVPEFRASISPLEVSVRGKRVPVSSLAVVRSTLK